MANSYYTKSYSPVNYTLADGGQLNTELALIETAFDSVETAVAAAVGGTSTIGWGNALDTRYYAGTTTGSSNAYSITLSGSPTGSDTITEGYQFTCQFNATNTGSITLNVGTSEGATTVKKVNSAGALANLASGDLILNVPYTLQWNGSNWIINLAAANSPYQSDSDIETAYNNQVTVASQAQAEGTTSTVYRWTPQRVQQAIAAHGYTQAAAGTTFQSYGSYNALVSVTGTAQTAAATWTGDMVECNNAATQIVTIGTSTFSAGDTFSLIQIGAGQVQVAAGTGMTMRKTSALSAATRQQYSVMSVYFRSATEFVVYGDLTLA